MVVGLALEPGERAEGADREHLEVGELALVRHELGQVGGLGGEGGGRVARASRSTRAPPWGAMGSVWDM